MPLCLGFSLPTCLHRPRCFHAAAQKEHSQQPEMGGAKTSCKMVQKAVFFMKYETGSDQRGKDQCWMGKGTGKRPVHKPSSKMQPQFPLRCLEMVEGCIQVCHRPSGNNHAEDQKSPILELWQVLPFPSGALEGGLWRNVWLMPSLWEEENMIVHSFLVPSIIFSDAPGEAYSFTCNICRTNFQKNRSGFK